MNDSTRKDQPMTSRRQPSESTQLSFEYLLDADRQPLRSSTESSHEDQSSVAAMGQRTLSDSPATLMERVAAWDMLMKAWKNVRRNGGAPGPDGMTIHDFPEFFREHWPTIERQLLNGTYQPGPVRRVSIPKDDGSQRKLGIPNVLDRFICQAILQILTPIFDPGFSESSFGFRPDRSAQDAAQQVQRHIRDGYRHCIDMDLSNFFDRVQHDVLMARVSRKVHDRRLLKLIGRYLRAGVMVDARLEPSIEGTMQGSPLSPLLANILLDDFDKELESRGLRFVRYADDFLVFTKTRASSGRVARSIANFLTRKLKLVINRQKSRLCHTSGVEFLGYRFEGYGGAIRVSHKNDARFKQRMRELTRRTRGVSMLRRFRELGRFVRGWVNHFRIIPIVTPFRDYDKWIRRRIRACYWKQWRYKRTRIAKLRQLGIRADAAVTHGCTSKGPWVMSSSQAVHEALSVEYLTGQGLVSLEEHWKKLTAKIRTA
jgi:RNA-directed DNA polymerase